MTGAPQPLPTIAGPLRPIGPELERELALLFERHEGDDGLAEAIVAWAFEQGLAVRSPLATDLAHLIVGRDGAARMVRVTAAPRRPPPKPRGDEWTASMPARRRL